MSLNVALLAILIGFNFTAGEQLVGFAQNCLSTGYQRCFVLGTENILITNEVGQILKFFRHNTAIDTSAVYFDVFSLSASLDVIILSPINQPILLISYDTNSDRFTKLSSRLPHATYLINGSISTAITGISSRSNSLTLLLAVASEDMDVPHDNCENCPSLHRFELAIDMSSETYSMTETGSHDDIVAAIDRRTPLDNVKSAQEIFAFSHNGFNYVVRNEFRPNRTQGNLQWVVYLSRVCAADNTDKLKSRVDLSLWCQLSGESYQVANTEADNHGLFARFAQLNVELQSLLVYFQPSDSSRLQRICKFPLSNIEVEFSEAERQCKEARKSDSHPNVFFFRYPGSFVGVPCGQNIVDKKLVGQCSPNMTNAYGVQSFVPLTGEIVATWKDVKAKEFLAYQNAIFITTENVQSNLLELHKIPANPVRSGEFVSAWSSSIQNPKSNLISQKKMVAVDNLILAINGTETVKIPLDCSLYDTCGKVIKSFDIDNLKCGWCTNEDGTGVSTQQQKCPSHFLVQKCPPIIINITYSPGLINSSTIALNIQGEDFDSVKISKIQVCDEECKFLKVIDSKRLSCDIQNSQTATKKCPVVLKAAMSYGSEKTILFSIPFESKGLPTGPSHQLTSTESSDGNRTAIIIGCIVGGVIVLTLLGLLLYLQRRKTSYKESPNMRDGSSVGLRLPSQLPVEMVWPRQLSHEYNHRPNGLPNRDGVFRAQDGSEIPYTQLPGFVPEEIRIAHESLQFTSDDIVGEGHFGVVYKGLYQPIASRRPIEVAIKTLQVHTGNMNVRQFLSEGLLMKDFDNRYVLSLVGIAFADGWLPLIVTPFMPNGNLLGYLRDPKNTPNLRQLLKFANEIAEGMQYLEKQKFVHRDLAARNCMLDANLEVRIADFGLSRDVYESGLYETNNPNGELPIKWMAPEAISNGVYNDKTDVWSFGIVLWEIMTRGQIPYTDPFVNNMQLLSHIRDGNRLPKPTFCPDLLYAVMTSSWLMNPKKRPTFTELCMRIPAVVKSLESRTSGSDMDRLYINLEERDYLVPNSQRPRSTPQAAFMSGTNETSGQSGDTIRSQRFSDDSGGSTAELLSHSQVVRYEKKPSEDIVSSV